MIYLKGLSNKQIIFSNNIIIKRRIFPDIILEYNDIEHIGFQNISTKKGKIMLFYMKSKQELLKIIGEKIEMGLIDFTEENKKSLENEIQDAKVILISFPITIIIYFLVWVLFLNTFQIDLFNFDLLNYIVFFILLSIIALIMKKYFHSK